MARTGCTLALAALLGASLFVTPARAQEGSLAQDLTNCAGAVAAHAGFDVLTFPRDASGEWTPVLQRIMDAMNTEPGVEGMTGRYASSAAREFWNEQPRDAREQAAAACRTRFGGE
ncbi:MAG: hypothetical protein J0L81_03240 [Caulobacterales bacterium]|jgi:hypothetical protein|nr:hypothetical protein [Caulobacterales bacterium]